MTTHTVKTEEDIIKAFQNESRAKWTYRAFAEKAEKEGNELAARLFRAAAEAEDIHAHSFLRALHETARASVDLWISGMYDPKTVKDSTTENLKEAINESREISDLYSDMIRDAEKDGWSFARDCFSYAGAVDRVHNGLFKKALNGHGRKRGADYYVCESCGNTIDHKPRGSCKICGSRETAFKAVH